MRCIGAKKAPEHEGGAYALRCSTSRCGFGCSIFVLQFDVIRPLPSYMGTEPEAQRPEAFEAGTKPLLLLALNDKP